MRRYERFLEMRQRQKTSIAPQVAEDWQVGFRKCLWTFPCDGCREGYVAGIIDPWQLPRGSASMGFPSGSEVKVSACNAGDLGSVPRLGRSPGEGNGNPLQSSCLENPMDRGAWWATVHGVAKSWTRLSDFTHSLCIRGFCICNRKGPREDTILHKELMHCAFWYPQGC